MLAFFLFTSSGDPIHLLTIFKTSKSQCGLEITGGSSSREMEFVQVQPCSRWVCSIPEGKCVVPRGVQTTAIGKSRPASTRRRCKSSRKKKALKWYTRQVKVEWKPPPKEKKPTHWHFSFCVFVLLALNTFYIFIIWQWFWKMSPTLHFPTFSFPVY